MINYEGNLPSKQHHLENALRERLYLGIVMVNVVAAIFTGHLPMIPNDSQEMCHCIDLRSFSFNFVLGSSL